MRKRLYSLFPAIIVVLWLVWLAGIMLTGQRVFLFGTGYDFATAAQFGDAFGSLSGLMASLAAAGAWYAVVLQRNQIVEQDKQAQKDEAQRKKQAFEQNFFQLLSHLAPIVRETEYSERRGMDRERLYFSGKDAFGKMLGQLRQQSGYDLQRSKYNFPEWTYRKFYLNYQDDLGNYFRVLFHIANYVYINKEIDRAFYLKSLFAQLSNSALILLGYNCVLGHGKGKFLPIVEEFQGLSNIGWSSAGGYEEVLFRSRFTASSLPSR